MKNLVLVLDRLVSDGLWEFCLGDILNNYEGMVVNVMFARNATYRANVNPEDELLVVCESEEQAKKEWEQLLGEETINRCLLNLTGDVSITIASDFMDTLSVCEDALIGVALEEGQQGELEVMVIYDK